MTRSRTVAFHFPIIKFRCIASATHTHPIPQPAREPFVFVLSGVLSFAFARPLMAIIYRFFAIVLAQAIKRTGAVALRVGPLACVRFVTINSSILLKHGARRSREM